MKRFLSVLVLLSLVFSIYLNAEEMKMTSPMPEKWHQRYIEKLSEELNLTEKQKEEISKIMKDGWKKIEEERKKMKKKVFAIREDTDKKIEKLLTLEQLEKFKKFREERRLGKWKKFERKEGTKKHIEKFKKGMGEECPIHSQE